MWYALVARSQLKTEATIDYFYDKVKLCNDLNLSFEETKTQLLEGFYSQNMVTYLLSRPHTDTDSKLNDILTYKQLNKVRTNRYGSSKQSLNFPTQKNNGSIKNSPSSEPVQPKTRRYFNCYSLAHTIQNSPETKQKQGSCFNYCSMKHKIRDCKMKNKNKEGAKEDSTMMIEIDETSNQPFILNIVIECGDAAEWTPGALIDTVSPISILIESVVPPNPILTPVYSQLSGIYKSPLN